jgi:hypothetical protein
VWLFSGRPHARPTEESLLGVKIGEAQEEVKDNLGVSRVLAGNPWKNDNTRGLLGNILRPEDLALKEAGALAGLEVLATSDRRVCVLCYAGAVRAVVARDRRDAATAMKLKIGGDYNTLIDLYPEGGKFVELPRGEGRRYDALGIAFEVQGHQIKAITLYPPAKK